MFFIRKSLEMRRHFLSQNPRTITENSSVDIKQHIVIAPLDKMDKIIRIIKEFTEFL